MSKVYGTDRQPFRTSTRSKRREAKVQYSQKPQRARPKPIVLIGVWVMFLPGFLAGLAVAISVALQDAGSGSSGFVFFWIGMAIAVFSFVMLYKVTRNYLEPDGPTKDK